MTIANDIILALPSTGGIGTTIFYIAGSVLVLAAVVVLVARYKTNKKVYKEKDSENSDQ